MLIIDGNNVMGARPGTRWWRDRPGAMRTLIEEFRAAGIAGLLVFDGPAVPVEDGAGHGLEVRFAPGRGPNAADDAIVVAVRGADPVAEITVVTSDRELARRVRALGASVLGAGTFVARHGLR